MKKNFFKKLALVMALAITVTSVPVNNASAAAAPGFKSKAVKVNVGQTKKYNTANAKKYSVKFKVGNTKIATIKYSAGSKAVKVTGVAAGKTTLRADFKKYSTKKVTTVKVPVTVAEVKVAFTAKQTGAKIVTITSGKDLKDAKIEVKKGNNVVTSTAKVDGKTAVITLSANIAAETYTVTAGEETTTFVGEVAKTSKIEIPGDYAVANKNVILPISAEAVAAGNNKATVAYKVLNQFGEDLTKAVTVNVSASFATTVQNSTITLTLTQLIKEGDLASIVIVDPASGLSASKTVKISSKATVTEVALGEIYNKDSKVLTEGEIKDDFYLLVDLKDQYGNAITDVDAASAGSIVTLVSGLTNVGFVATDKGFSKVTVGTDTKLGLKLDKNKISAGTVNVLLIASNSGKSAQTTFKVADAVKVDTFSASPADMVVGGSKAVFEFTATDTYGKAIADPTKDMFAYSANVDGTKNYTGVPKDFDFVKNVKTGKTELVYNAAKTSTDLPAVVNFITATNKVITVSFTVKKTAYPVAIAKVKDFKEGVLINETNLLKTEQVVFEDQYGRELAAADAIGTINGKVYELVATTDRVLGDPTMAAKTGDKSGYNNLFDNSNKGVSLTSADEMGIQVVSSTTAASIKVTLTLKEGANVKDSKDVKFASKNINDLANFAVEDIKLVDGIAKATGSTNGRLTSIGVTGTASDGIVVKLPNRAYQVYGQLAASAGAITIDGSNLFVRNEAVSEKDGSFDVVILNDKGTKISKTVKVSNAPVKATTVDLRDGNEIKANAGKVATADLAKFVKVCDQYGRELVAPTENAPRITIATATDLKISKNGTNVTEITDSKENMIITITYDYAGGATFTTNAKIVK
ncbi:MAG: hypothetical protein RSB37_01200 [Acetivibrio sp.]